MHTCTHSHRLLSQVFCVSSFRQKLAEKKEVNSGRKPNERRVIFIFDVWDQIPLWFPLLQCTVGKKSCTDILQMLQQQSWWAVSFPQLQAFSFSKMAFQVNQHNHPAVTLRINSVNWSKRKIFSYSPSSPILFTGVCFFVCLFALLI